MVKWRDGEEEEEEQQAVADDSDGATEEDSSDSSELAMGWGERDRLLGKRLCVLAALDILQPTVGSWRTGPSLCQPARGSW